MSGSEQISDVEREKRRKAVANAAASMSLSGFARVPAAEAIYQRYIDGEIDALERERLILDLAGRLVPVITEEERRRRVEAMRANFAQEGMHPDAEHAALLERYVAGTATLNDLLDHARAYAATAQLRARDRATIQARATVVLEGGAVSDRVQENAKRYVLGELGIDEFLALNGSIGALPGDVDPPPESDQK